MARVKYCVVLLLVGLGLASALNIRATGIQNIGWWNNTAFYQIYPRSFMDLDGNGIGDLKGITSKLDHFVDIGVGAIWLSPIYTSPMADFGYDIANFKDISPDYGNMADFEALTAKAKELKLKVILDLVPNHASDENEWFTKSAANETGFIDFFIWKNGKGEDPTKTPPNNWISVFGGSAWTYHETRKQWYFHQFHRKQPDLNYRSQAVQAAMADVITFWLGKGVDGFRVDAVPHLYEVEDLRDEPRSNDTSATEAEYIYLDHPYTKDQPETYTLVKSWRKILDDYATAQNTDEKVMMTEAYTGLDKTVEFYDAGSHIPFNFKFITEVNSKSAPSDFKKIIDEWMIAANEKKGISNWVMGNHDNKRTETRYPNRGDQMTMLAMILPGVSVTYYGEEIGMVDKSDITYEETQDPQGINAGPDKYKEMSRDPCRTPFQWDTTPNAGFSTNLTAKTWIPIHSNYLTLNLAAQKAAPVSHYNTFKSLTKLKSTVEAIKTGSLKTVVKNSNKALAVLRSVTNHTVILVINFSEMETLNVDLTAEIPARIALKGIVQAATVQSPLQKGASVDLANVALAPNSSLVILANQRRAVVNPDGENTGGGADSTLISFNLAVITLIATLIITFS